jgi:hypothetical protein
MPLGYPLLNGPRQDAGSIEIKLNAKRYIGIKSISYKQEIDPGVVYGGLAQPLGFTRGIYKPVEGEIVFLREEFVELTSDLQILAVGLLEAQFAAIITYSEVPPASVPGNPLNTSKDEILGMRFKASDHKAEFGTNDGLVVAMPFMALMLFVNGKAPLNSVVRAVTAASAP